MELSGADYGKKLHQHIHTFFSGHRASLHKFERGPIQETVRGFHVIEVEPGPVFDHWVYVSVGCGMLGLPESGRMEFVIASSEEDERCMERLAMTTHYHSTQTLGIGHSFPLGEPWVQGSKLDHVIVSLPYPFGEELEIFSVGGDHVHLFWLLPVTSAEQRYKAQHGLDALEQKFDEAALNYLDWQRESVVS